MRHLVIIICAITLFNFCASRSLQTEFAFANKMAKEGLWKEAYFRWQKLLPQKTDSAALHNNIAVALEQMGKIEEAEKEYKRALKLAPGSNYIQKNYERFKDSLKKTEEPEDQKPKSRKNKKRKGKNER